MKHLTSLPCDAEPPALLQTVMQVGVHVNADTVIEAEKCERADGSEYMVIALRDPRTGSHMNVFIEEADLLRLWFHAEAARVIKVGA